MGAVSAVTSALVLTHRCKQAVDVSGGIGEEASRGQVAGQGVCEQVAVADELGPWLDPGRDATLDPVRLRQVAGCDPQAFDSEAEQRLGCPSLPGPATAVHALVQGWSRASQALPERSQRLGAGSCWYVVGDHVDISADKGRGRGG